MSERARSHPCTLTSLDWKHTASSVARHKCVLLVKFVSPMMIPRASVSQYGAYRPEKAGTKYTSPVLSADLAMASVGKD